MSIIELGALGEFIGAFAVLATLAYLGVQIRHNTHSMNENRKQAIVQTQQQWTGLLNDALISIAKSELLPSIIVKAETEGIGSLTEDERQRMVLLNVAATARLDNMLMQFEQGFLDKEVYETAFTNAVRDGASNWKELGVLEYRRHSFRAEVDRFYPD